MLFYDFYVKRKKNMELKLIIIETCECLENFKENGEIMSCIL